MKPARKIFLGGMLAAAVMAVAPSARAQIQTTGEPGSPSATTTINGKQLPPPDPKFGGMIKETAVDSKPYWYLSRFVSKITRILSRYPAFQIFLLPRPRLTVSFLALAR